MIAALSDDELISRITRSEPVPDADDHDPVWLDDATWDRAEFLRAAADAIGERQLVAVPPAVLALKRRHKSQIALWACRWIGHSLGHGAAAASDSRS